MLSDGLTRSSKRSYVTAVQLCKLYKRVSDVVIDKVEQDGEYFSESVYLNIPCPQEMADFFKASSVVDIHDHIYKGILGMERYWLTKVWWRRIYG
jgi:hypothetical protein